MPEKTLLALEALDVEASWDVLLEMSSSSSSACPMCCSCQDCSNLPTDTTADTW